VTCYSCHRGADSPRTVPDFAVQYGPLLPPDPNAIIAQNPLSPMPDAVFDKYLQAVGGAQRAAALTSFVATGTYAGFNTGDEELPVEIFAKAPNLRSQSVKTFEGPAVTVFDGRSGAASEPWRHLPLVTFTGGGLAGAKLDALLNFPAGLQAAFSQWKGSPIMLEDNRKVLVLQGVNGGELPVNFYFDDSGMLVRVVRWTSTPEGNVPTQIDFADYREVAGVKIPFETVTTWTYGRDTVKLQKVQPNVAIDASRFILPGPFQPQKQQGQTEQKE